MALVSASSISAMGNPGETRTITRWPRIWDMALRIALITLKEVRLSARDAEKTSAAVDSASRAAATLVAASEALA